MQRGRKAEPPSTLAARGTFQPCRASGRTEIVVPGDPPMMPDYLTPEAQIVWQEEIGRVMAAGVAEPDSSLFARYCATEALARKAFQQGEAVPASVLTVLRQYAEMLRIAGPKSRVGVGDNGKASNPFARNGARARA